MIQRLLLVAITLGCGGRDSSSRETQPGIEVPAALLLVKGLDEEGGMAAETLLPDTIARAFFRDHVAFVDARAAVDYLAPETRVNAVGTKLTLDGDDTGIPVESRHNVSFVPIQAIANRFNAYARPEESPGRMVALWRNDVLCRYARDADRRAPVFLEAAEQGLLRHCNPPIEVRVRRWVNASPGERWAASVTLRQPLDSASAAALLQRYGATPYAVYGGAAGHHLIVRVPADSASPNVLARLRTAGIEALERALCGLPDALDRRTHGIVSRTHRPDADAFHGERGMLASTLVAKRELPHLRIDAPIIYGLDAIGTAGNLRQLAADSRILRFDAATKLENDWVLPGADMSVVAGIPMPADVASLDSANLFARLEAEARQARAECKTGGRISN